MRLDEKEYLAIRNLQLVIDAQSVLENLDASEIPNPPIGLSSEEFRQVIDLLRGWERRLREVVETVTG